MVLVSKHCFAKIEIRSFDDWGKRSFNLYFLKWHVLT